MVLERIRLELKKDVTLQKCDPLYIVLLYSETWVLVATHLKYTWRPSSLVVPWYSETWVFVAAYLKYRQAFIMGCAHVILGVTRWGQKKNIELRSMGDLKKVDMIMMRRILRWLGHFV